jgi:hypothetical protein|tara:strand:+ start:335 stop:655 length:321 start_codon:yes stop_codon:yes gene_type:complete
MAGGEEHTMITEAILIAALLDNPVSEACTFNGIPLYGEVEIVESFADIQVQVVDSFPDLRVKTVESFADSCGEWEFVDSFPDFTVEFVSSFGDIKIEFVESFPGRN